MPSTSDVSSASFETGEKILISSDELYYPSTFLDTFREELSVQQLRCPATTPARFAIRVAEVVGDASELLDHQVDQLSLRVGGFIEKKEQNIKSYKSNFLRTVKHLATVSFMMSESDSSFPSSDLLEKTRREAILKQLSRDYRRIGLTLSGDQVDKVVPSVWVSARPHIHSPEQVAELVNEKSQIVGMMTIKRYLAIKPFETSEAIGESRERFYKLKDDPRFKKLHKGIIKIASERRDMDGAIEYLCGVVEDIEKYSKHKKYRIFGVNAITSVVSNTRNNLDKKFEKMYDTYSKCSIDPTLSMLTRSQIRTIIVRHVDPERAEKALQAIRERFRLYRRDPDFGILPSHAITRLILDNPNPKTLERRMEKILATLQDCMANDHYAKIGKKVILHILISSPNRFEENIGKALRNIEILENDPRFKALLPRKLKIIKSTIIFSSNFISKMKKLTITYERVRQNPEYEEFEDYLLQEATIDHSTSKLPSFLKKAKKAYEALSNEHPFSTFSPQMIRMAVIKQPRNPKKFLMDRAEEGIRDYEKSRGIKLTKEQRQFILDNLPRKPHTALKTEEGKKVTILSTNGGPKSLDELYVDEDLAIISAKTIREAYDRFGAVNGERILRYMASKR